jgi:hypothetical protein
VKGCNHVVCLQCLRLSFGDRARACGCLKRPDTLAIARPIPRPPSQRPQEHGLVSARPQRIALPAGCRRATAREAGLAWATCNMHPEDKDDERRSAPTRTGSAATAITTATTPATPSRQCHQHTKLRLMHVLAPPPRSKFNTRTPNERLLASAPRCPPRRCPFEQPSVSTAPYRQNSRRFAIYDTNRSNV